ncbi:MAG: HlyD family efflux transporter periplasmic adaptor subunit [Bacteroidetes bacterium]|nr:HlyD family efflux transporter periplasmic adaptor subunit [Bacteroidota bacterium]
MKRNNIFFLVVAGVIIILIIWFAGSSDKQSANLVRVPVSFGLFEISVSTTGELEAKNSEKISGPSGLRSVRIYSVKIEDIVPDGTVVDSGDWVATLDRTELENRMKDMETELEQLESQVIKTQLDTSLELRNSRNEIINLKYNMEEIKIELELSIYEPPSTIRQLNINLDKAERSYTQAVENYDLILRRAEANMTDVLSEKIKNTRDYQQMLTVLSKFTVMAPKAGMVIYKRSWDGSKQGVGAQLNSWDPVVATLPNLTVMNSRTYVNEIDISKIQKGQNVSIGVDAFPDNNYTGIVVEVANIGEQLNNTNAKVFEVMLEVNEYDTILRPAMTTKNKIITDLIDSVYFVPLEAIHNQDDITFVYIRNKKRQVITGASNDNEIIIRAGLNEQDEVYLIPPKNNDSYSLLKLDTAIINKLKRLDEEQLKSNKTNSGSDAEFELFKKNLPEQMKNRSDEELRTMLNRIKEHGMDPTKMNFDKQGAGRVQQQGSKSRSTGGNTDERTRR